MPAASARERLQVGTAIWHSYSNFVVCQHDHLLRFLETGYRVDMRRLSGHAFLQCRECNPPTYFLAVFSTSPDPHVTCYSLSRDSYEEWDKSDELTPPTPELLYRIRDPQGRSFNPYWRGGK